MILVLIAAIAAVALLALWAIEQRLTEIAKLLRWIGRDYHRMAEAQKPSGSNPEPSQ